MEFKTKKCNHGDKGRCINCLTQQIKVEKKQNPDVTAEHKSKCFHPPNMKCLKCISANENKKVTENVCNHPSYERCSKCYNKEKLFYSYTFEEFIQRLNLDCKHKKPCKKCVPPLTRQTFLVDRDCRKHLPYPQAQCDSCMPPTVSIYKQPYTHIKNVVVRTTAIYKITETNLFGILLGSKEDNITYIDDVYFPRQQQKVYRYIDPSALLEDQQIIEFLSYKQVGILFSSSMITSMDLMLSAVFQDYFLTVNKEGYHHSDFITMRLNNDDIDPYFECFMVSDLFQALRKNNLIFQKQGQTPYFDLVTAKTDKQLKDSPSLPTFLRQGIETEDIKFEQIILWVLLQIQTSFPQDFTPNDPNLNYPFYTIEEQSLDNIEVFMSVEVKDTVQKFRNLQFILHIDKVFGRESVMLFLTNYIFCSPQEFLKQKLRSLKQKKGMEFAQNLMIDQSYHF